MPQALPANPDLDWLKKTAKRRLAGLRAARPDAKLHEAQLLVAREYGFASWRALKARVDAVARVFAAARAGDAETIRRAIAAGFDPATTDADGRTVHQIAKELKHAAVEILVRDAQGGTTRQADEQQKVQDIVSAAQSGDVAALAARLDARPDLIDALGGRGFQKATALHLAVLRNRHDAIRLLLARGADPAKRDFPDNATALHFAALFGDPVSLGLLLDAGADPNAGGDDHGLGVLGWATCLRELRAEAAALLLARGAKTNLWSAIALDLTDDLRGLVAKDKSLLAARMTRNHHRRTALHHAAARNRPAMVRLLLDLGADPFAVDATGATALTTAAREHVDPAIVSMLQGAGLRLDLSAALELGRYDDAETLLRDDPSRLRAGGRDAFALHLAVAKKNANAVAWLLAHGAEIDAKRSMWDCDHTVLQMCVESGAIDIARQLLDAGADPNVKDDKYEATALGWARFFGREDFAALFRARGGVT